MRFLMLNWRDPKNPKAGGAERVSQAYLAELVRRGHEVYWYANMFAGGREQEVLDGIHIVRGGGMGTSILQARRWYRRQARFDLVIDQHHGIPWMAPWWCHTRCLAYIHEVLGPIWNSFYPWPLSLLGRWQEAWGHFLYRRVPFWVPSDSTRQSLLARGVKQVQVFPNGTDTLPLARLEEKGMSPPLRLITVSRLAPNKRIDHALRVLQGLSQAHIPAQLVIVGTGEMESSLRECALALGLANQVTFTGQVEEARKNQLLGQAHFLIHTSVREGWGLNVIEANAMGTPAVVYPVGGLVDSTLHQQTGLICGQETPESMVQTLVEAVRRPQTYPALRRQAWERAKTLQWDQVLGPACDWLEQQAGKGTPG